MPTTLWDTIKVCAAETYKQTIAFKAQNLTYMATMPLLSVLSDSDPNDLGSRNKISTAIQLICSANLQLNKFRRSMISPFLKKDLKRSLLSHPVKHDNLFGHDFAKVTDQVIKEQTATNKLCIMLNLKSLANRLFQVILNKGNLILLPQGTLTRPIILLNITKTLILNLCKKGTTSPFVQTEEEATEEEAVEPEDIGEIMAAPEIGTRELNSAAGNITRYYENWIKITKNAFILRIVAEVYSFQCLSKPICNNPVISGPSSNEKILSLKGQISKLLNAGAISEIPKNSNQFVSRVFTVKKPNGNDRLIIDLSLLNKFILNLTLGWKTN